MPEPKDKVTVWEAFDGKEFDSEWEAQRYEDKHWEKIKCTYRAISERWANGSLIQQLDECSSSEVILRLFFNATLTTSNTIPM